CTGWYYGNYGTPWFAYW
nr:immunoglobulin heavy chain junction region [Mus musculus]MBK4195049.1 immunoglobulin heavy chain junction region [Mus musculus]